MIDEGYLRKTTITIATILNISATIPIWLVPYPPLTDYPKHLLLAKVISEYNNPVFPYSNYFDLHRFPVPNLIFQIGMLFLQKLFDVLIAGKILLTLSMILFPFSIFYFLHSINKDKLVFGLFAYPFIYNWYFNLGLVNFYIGLGLFFLTLGFWWRKKDKFSIQNQIILAILFILLYLSHVFVYAASILALGMLSVLCLQKFRYFLKWLAPIFPSLILFFSYYYLCFSAPGAKYPFGFSNLPDLLIQFLVSFLYFSKKEVLLYCLPLIFYLFFFIHMLKTIKPLKIENGKFILDFRTKEGQFLVLFILFLALYFILPWYGFGGWGLNQRLNLIIVFIGVATFCLPRRVFLIYGFIILISISSLMFYTYNFNWYKKIDRQYEDFASGIQYIEDNKIILPIILDIKGDSIHTEPFRGFWAYYHLKKGGVGPYFFAMPGNHPVTYKEEKVKQFLKNPFVNNFKSENLDVRSSQLYDYILVWGKDKDIFSKIEKRFTLIYKKGNLHIYKKAK